MKTTVGAILLASAAANDTIPNKKVVQMMSALQAKIIGEGEECQKTYEEFSAMCHLQAEAKATVGADYAKAGFLNAIEHQQGFEGVRQPVRVLADSLRRE